MIKTLKINNLSKIVFAAGFVLFAIFLVVELVYVISLLLGVSAGVLLGLATALKSLNVFASPISTLAFIIFITLIILIQVSKKANTKAVLFNIAFIFLAVGIFETYLQNEQIKNSAVAAMNSVKVDAPVGFWQTDEFIGPVPGKGKAYPITSHYGKELLYDVTYTIDEDGLRVAPPFNETPDSESIVFFGCSVTFGYGLEDYQAFPYILGEKVKDQYKIYNFAFGGYGPHHMLAALDHGFAKKVIDVKPKLVIFTAIPDHLRRVVNNTSWGARDPKYILENGKAVYAGHFDDDQSVLSTVRRKIEQSLIFERFFKKQSQDESIDLFTAIVTSSRDRVAELYPNAKFIVIFWDDVVQTELCDKMVKGLTDKGIEVNHILDILPDYERDWSKYQIRYPMEPHPNYDANKYVANYIYKNIVNSSKN